MRTILMSALVACSLTASAQDSSHAARPNPINFSAYLETYYSYDFGSPDNHTRPAFIYSHNRHNEVNLNVGVVKAGYATDNVRANLALMAGTYANANLAAEPGVLKNISEANVGVKISKRKNLWIDAGIFASHLGFESAISKDCWTLTRSILAENSPYFEAGAKITYISKSEKWLLSGLLLNGWQRIQRVDGNNTAAFGHQLTYKPIATITFNSSSFVGSDKPDTVRQMRYFHNLYAIVQLTKKFGITAGFDIGAEQTAKGSKRFNSWYSPVLILKLNTTDKTSLAVRGEYYSDNNGVIIGTGTSNGFKTWGYSMNFDQLITQNIVWRLEARGFNSKDQIFTKHSKQPANNNFFATTSLAVSF